MSKFFYCFLLILGLFTLPAKAKDNDVYQRLDLVLDSATLGLQVDMLDTLKWPKHLRRHFADAVIRQLGHDLKMSGVLTVDLESGRFQSNTRDLNISYFESMGNEPILILSLWVIADAGTEDVLPALENEKSFKIFMDFAKSLASHFKNGYQPIMAGGLKGGRQAREAHFQISNHLTGLRLKVMNSPSFDVLHLIKGFQGPLACELVFRRE